MSWASAGPASPFPRCSSAAVPSWTPSARPSTVVERNNVPAMLSDFHLHTFVSDGELDPVAVLRHAAARGVDSLSLTDHDALGAYRWQDGEVFSEARRLHLELTVGIEMDAD